MTESAETSDLRPSLVSVVIPAYNAANTLAATLDSALAQTYPNLEVIVVDDGSTDATGEVLRNYEGKVRLVRKANGGLASARNAGCAFAKGKYVALLDADDLCMPERIGVQVQFMQSHADAILCSSEFSAFDEDGPLESTFAARYYAKLARTPGSVGAIYQQQESQEISRWLRGSQHFPVYCPILIGHVYHELVQGNFIHPPTVLFRRELLSSHGMFNERVRNQCDWEWLVRVARTGRVGYIDRPLLNYRLSETQLSGSRHRLTVSLDILMIRENFARVDPELMRLGRNTFGRSIGTASINAADALVETDRWQALRLLRKALHHGVVDKSLFKVVFKAILPKVVLAYWRARHARRQRT